MTGTFPKPPAKLQRKREKHKLFSLFIAFLKYATVRM
jgi:hypothetical protein